MSTRLAAVLGAGAEAFGHGSDATGAPQPRATRDAARARWGKDWWKVAKDARLAQLGSEGYKVEQPSRPKPRGAKPDRPKPRGAKPDRPKWDDDDPNPMAKQNAIDSAAVAYMRSLNAEAAAKYGLIPDADKQAPEDMQLLVYHDLLVRSLGKYEDELDENFTQEGSMFTGLGEDFEELNSYEWNKLYLETYPQVAMLKREREKALLQCKASKHAENFAVLRRNPNTGFGRVYQLCVPAMKETINEARQWLEGLTDAELLVKLGTFAQTYAALVTSAEAMVYPQTLIIAGMLESELKPRLDATNAEMENLLMPEDD